MKIILNIYVFHFTLIIMSFYIFSCKEDQKIKSRKADTKKADSTTKDSAVFINLKMLLANRNDKDALPVEVKYDHYFKTAKKYKGFLLTALLDSIVATRHFDTSRALLVFDCSDGYKPVMDYSKLNSTAKGYIVYKDLDLGNEIMPADSPHKKFEPYYLVWDDVKKEDESFIWPFGINSIRLIPMDVEYKAIYPYDEPTLIAGFNLFRNNCMKCHSLNKVGGSMAPEFNIPRNITEYWKEETIISFAKNPGAYRYNSRMPQMDKITDAEFKQIVAYLKYMKQHKLQD